MFIFNIWLLNFVQDDVSHIETMESHYSLDESDGNETAIIDDNNLLNAHNSHDIQDDDMNEVNYFKVLYFIKANLIYIHF